MFNPVSTDDYVAITDQMGRYCHYIDEGEAEAWAACYTPDGVFDGPATPAPVGGHAALAGFARGTAETFKGNMRHQVANLTCDYGASRDEVIARLYNLVTTWSEGGTATLMAVCKVTFVRTGEGWRIKRNAYRLLGMG